jgi:hypothetical protein
MHTPHQKPCVSTALATDPASGGAASQRSKP